MHNSTAVFYCRWNPSPPYYQKYDLLILCLVVDRCEGVEWEAWQGKEKRRVQYQPAREPGPLVMKCTLYYRSTYMHMNVSIEVHFNKSTFPSMSPSHPPPPPFLSSSSSFLLLSCSSAAATAVDAVLAASRPKSKPLTAKQRLGKILGLSRGGRWKK